MPGSIKRYFSNNRILLAFNLATIFPVPDLATKYECIGTCTEGARQGEKCLQMLTKANWDAGVDAIARLKEDWYDDAFLREELAYAAGKLLCVRFHQDQKYDVVEEWLGTPTTWFQLSY